MRSSLLLLQEHLAILRQLAVLLPEKFGELSALSSTDIEVDFFANVAHLQVHRRIRALRRLVRVRISSSCCLSHLLTVNLLDIVAPQQLILAANQRNPDRAFGNIVLTGRCYLWCTLYHKAQHHHDCST